MRPPNARESKAFQAHLEGEGDERPGVGAERLCGWHLTWGPAVREVVVGPRCGESRDRDLPPALWLCTSRMMMDFRARFSRLLDLGPSPLASISRVVGWVPRVWGTADPAATRTSRMAGDHRGARPGALVLDRAPAPPAPWLGFPP
jgi:hypothetical protein